MNAVVGYHDDEMSYAVDFGRDREPTTKRSRLPEYRRKGSGPARVNGIHCRRSKRWTWGSGRGARLQNIRAFASCLAIAVASLTASSFGVTIEYRTIGTPNIGNPANNNLGGVSAIFRMAATETTNAQYVQFLNSVDSAGNQPLGIYNSNMGSSPVGGILFNSGSAAGFKYSVKAGAPAGAPAGTSYANMPVNFVTWFSAARFVNWLENNQASGTAAMETGAYALNGQTTGAPVARNPNAQNFLPSLNEWYKGAFYNSTGNSWFLWGTASNSQPANTLILTGTNSANYGGTATTTAPSPIGVGSYTNTRSAYQLFDMIGNVTEWTDTAAGGSNANIAGGNFNVSLGNISQWNSTNYNPALRVGAASTLSQATGFRVAAVPEPGTIALAGVGIAGLAGLDWMKRRKKRLAARQAA